MRITHVVVAIAAVATLACGGSKPQDVQSGTAAPASPNATPQSPPQTAGLQPVSQPIVKPVDFEQLVALLPEVTGWTKGKPRGEQVATAVAMSHAKAEYAKGDASIDLDITDSSFNQLVLSPITMFLAPGYSERSSDGYTKSSRIAGHPAFEKWNEDARRGEVTVVIANRFIVQAVGRNVENVDPVLTAVRAVDFGRISSLR